MAAEKYFKSQAKLLLTGEYLVILGARALALPLKYSQSLTVKSGNVVNLLDWKALEYDNTWFTAELSLPDLSILKTSSIEIANRLVSFLKAARELDPEFLEEPEGIEVITRTDFDRQWGWGTSSTLISNIADWANVNPFYLHWKVSSGSGYDIACAKAETPIVYSVKNKEAFTTKANISESITDLIYFVYLGKKQDSAKSISPFLDQTLNFKSEIDKVSEITDRVAQLGSGAEFQRLMKQHEEIISGILGTDTVQKTLFPDFQGVIKSLGAWGGDFVAAISNESQDKIKQYFKSKGYTIIFRYADICL